MTIIITIEKGEQKPLNERVMVLWTYLLEIGPLKLILQIAYASRKSNQIGLHSLYKHLHTQKEMDQVSYIRTGYILNII